MEHWPSEIFLDLLRYLLIFFAAAYLLHVLKGLLTRQKRLSLAEKIENPKDILQVLRTAYRQRSRFKVHMNDRKRSFNSMLLDFSGGVLTLDSLFPAEGNLLIKDSEFITIDMTLREADNDLLHIPYQFQSKHVSSIRYRGYPAIKIAFPTLIRRIQRRNYLRIDPPVNEPVYISFKINGEQVREKISNISGGGLGFHTNLGKAQLWTGKKTRGATISLPAGLTIQCSIVVHILTQSERPVLIDSKPYYFYCGVGFEDIDDKVREQIVHYVIEKERQALKKLSRGFD